MSIDTAMASLALAVSIATFCFTVWRDSRNRRWTNTILFHDEYYSSVFARQRSAAYRFVSRNSKARWSAIGDLHSIDSDPSGAGALYDVMRFFHRLSYQLQINRLHNAQTTSLFAQTFGWWFGYIFERMEGRPDWRLGPDIKSLAIWMSEQSADWERFVAKGRSDYAEHLGEQPDASTHDRTLAGQTPPGPDSALAEQEPHVHIVREAP